MNADLLDAIKKYDAKFIDLRFTDSRGKEHHITLPAGIVDQNFVNDGKMFDGSSINKWKSIHESDLGLLPEIAFSHFLLDPFYHENTLIVRCNVFDPSTKKPYERCPRSLALRAETFLKESGIADYIFFGPEPEFFIFDDVRYESGMRGAFYSVDSESAHWNSGKLIEGGNTGHRPGIKGGYFPVPPVDPTQDIRSEIALTLESMGIPVEAHHHEVGGSGQCEVATKFDSLTIKADHMQMLKYIVRNVAHNYGKTATFMPKPIVGDNGNGMHCHVSLMKDGQNLFSGNQYAGLSDTALYFIGGIIHHAKALNAFTNPTTNSYKRLVPGFEAPVLLAYSARNRSASIRIPYVATPKAARIEIRFPDPAANPYLAFSAMMMAGIDGIEKKMHPGDPMDKDLYELPEQELIDIPTVCSSLEQSIECLAQDHAFLLRGDVFTKDFLDSYVSILKDDVAHVRSLVHPIEFELYYSL